MTPETRQLLERAAAVRALPADAAVPSPCVSVCRLDPARGECEGCRRTLDEIAAWPSLSVSGRRAVWLRLEQRTLKDSTP